MTIETKKKEINTPYTDLVKTTEVADEINKLYEKVSYLIISTALTNAVARTIETDMPKYDELNSLMPKEFIERIDTFLKTIINPIKHTTHLYSFDELMKTFDYPISLDPRNSATNNVVKPIFIEMIRKVDAYKRDIL